MSLFLWSGQSSKVLDQSEKHIGEKTHFIVGFKGTYTFRRRLIFHESVCCAGEQSNSLVWVGHQLKRKGSFTPSISVSGSISIDARNGYHRFKLYYSDQGSAEIPFESIDASVNSDIDAWCELGLRITNVRIVYVGVCCLSALMTAGGNVLRL